MEYIKTYVEVDAHHTADGTIIPKVLYWKDSTAFEIQKVSDIVPRHSLKVGGLGLRYRCLIDGSWTYLFYEDTIDEQTGEESKLWFVEEKVID